jgi:hypothetical protein
MMFLGLKLLPTDLVKLGSRRYGGEPYVDKLFADIPLPASDLYHYLEEYEQDDRECTVIRSDTVITRVNVDGTNVWQSELLGRS